MKHFCLFFCLLPFQVATLEPISTGLSVGGALFLSALWNSKDIIVCQVRECCAAPWLTRNATHLESKLKENVFGQHLVTSLVSRAVRAHLRKESPSKALVLSFHGWTGGGKNYVARWVAESVFSRGMASSYVHLFIATLHFPNREQADIYKLQVQDWIRGNVSQCETSIFIFDEVDKMPAGVIDGIKPFIDHHEQISGMNFRKSIFIFLSNTGGRDITRESLRIWGQGRQRESISYSDLESLINRGAFNELGGLHKSAIIDSSLIDLYVPFLPLERLHVRQCVWREAANRNVSLSAEEVEAISGSLTYWPEESQLFSITGCKKVANRLDLHLEEREEFGD